MFNIVYDSEITSPPTYLDVAFFEEVVETAVRTARIKLKSIHIKMGSSAGDNYCSKIYRVKIKYENTENDNKSEELGVIIKAILQEEGTEILEDLQVFLKEKTTYYEILPRLELLLRCKRHFGPKLYQHVKHPENALAFSDLGTQGFEMASREEGLNLRHATLVMERIAEFHAASMVLGKIDTKIFETYTSGLVSHNVMTRENGMLVNHIKKMCKEMHKMVSTWPGFERIADKIHIYLDNQKDNVVKSAAPQDNEIKVFNHGDLWVNNMLFKYDESRTPKDVIFLDFQMSFWGTPAMDLNYFFYSSLSLDVLKQHRIELIKIYHEKLEESLQLMNMDIPIPTFEQILDDIKRREGYGFLVNYAFLPSMSQDKSESGDNTMTNLADEDFATKKIAQMYKSKRLADTLRYTLPLFEEIGVF